MKNFLATTLLLALVACADRHNGSRTSAEEDRDFYCGRFSLADFQLMGVDRDRDWLVNIFPGQDDSGIWTVESVSPNVPAPAAGTFPAMLMDAVAEVRNLDPNSVVHQSVHLVCLGPSGQPAEYMTDWENLTVGLAFLVNDKLVAQLTGEIRWAPIETVDVKDGFTQVIHLTDLVGGLQFLFPRYPFLVTDNEGGYIDYTNEYDPTLGFGR